MPSSANALSLCVSWGAAADHCSSLPGEWFYEQLRRYRRIGERLMWWPTLLGVLSGLLLVYLVLLWLLWRYARRHPDTVTLRDALRLLPDVVRLIRRLAADRTVPTGCRVWLVFLLIYLASPIDLVPDFVPVLGYADDAVIVALVLRSVTRRGGPDALARHWPGTTDGLRLIEQLAGLPNGSRRRTVP